MRYCKKCGREMRESESVCRFCGTFDPHTSDLSAQKMTVVMNAVSLAFAALILLPCAALWCVDRELLPLERATMLILSSAFFAIKLLSLIICSAFWWAKRATRETLLKIYIVLTVMGTAINIAFWVPYFVWLFVLITIFLPTSLFFVTPFVLQIISCVMLLRQVRKEEEYR